MARKFIKRKSAVKPITGSIVDTKNIIDKTTNTYSARVIDELVSSGSGNVDIATIIDLIYPIGRGFIDFTDTDYSHWLGLTWERELIGVSPIGYNPDDADFNQIGKTGGEKKHTLTENELARHSHGVQGLLSGNQTGGVPIGGGVASGSYSMGLSISTKELTESDRNPWLLKAVKKSGTTTPHNNLQPYQVVSYWKRVDPNAKTMISFTIAPSGTNTGDSIVYQAEKGMTFLEWYNSDYNTWDTNKSYYISTSDTFSSGGSSLYCKNTKTSEYVYGKDTITNGTIIYWYSSEK